MDEDASPAGAPERDHDALPLDEVLRRLEAAEAMIREARAALASRWAAAATEGPPGDAPQEAAAPEAPAGPPASGTEEIPLDMDPVLLGRHAPPGPEEDYRAAVTSLFRLALESPPDEEIVEVLLTRLMHSEVVAGELAVRSVLSFPWRRFVRFLDQYLASPGDPASFHVARTRPADASGADRLKVFLQARGRSPAPVDVARDPGAEGAWRIVAFSL